MLDDERKTLEIEKLKADLKGARFDLFLRPLQLLTPIILAVGIYVLVQQPQMEKSNSSMCLEQIRFVNDLASMRSGQLDEESAHILAGFPFQCDAAQRAVDVLMVELESGERIARADEVIRQSREIVDPEGGVASLSPEACEEHSSFSPVLFDSLLREVEVSLRELHSSAVSVERALAANAEEAAIEEMTGRGQRWRALSEERSQLTQRLDAIRNDISEREEVLSRLQREWSLISTSCASRDE